MKKATRLTILVLGLMVWLPELAGAAPMSTAITYQGRLMDANSAADGEYDFEFKLFDANVAGTQQGSTIDMDNLDATDGYFTTELDFGSSVFSGDARWLQIGVRPGDSTGGFITLSPRQEIKPAPYALYAASGTPGPKGDTGPTGPPGPMGPEGPPGDTTSSIEDFIALGQIGTISIQELGQYKKVLGIRFGISALAPPGPHGTPEAVDEVELILDGSNPWLLTMIEDMNDPAHTYNEVLVDLSSKIRLRMRDVTVNSVDFFGSPEHIPCSSCWSLAYVSLSIRGDFDLDIADDDQIRYDVYTGLIDGPDCETEVFNVYPHNVVGVSPPYIPLTDYDVQISRLKVGFPCISTIVTKTESYQGTACIWTNCLSLSSIDTVWVRLFSYDFYTKLFSLDTSFEISQVFPQRVKIYSTSESGSNNPVQMEMTYKMNRVVIHDEDQGNHTTVVSCQKQ